MLTSLLSSAVSVRIMTVHFRLLSEPASPALDPNASGFVPAGALETVQSRSEEDGPTSAPAAAPAEEPIRSDVCECFVSAFLIQKLILHSYLLPCCQCSHRSRWHVGRHLLGCTRRHNRSYCKSSYLLCFS